MAVDRIVVTSENLITNRCARARIGMQSSSMDQALAIAKEGLLKHLEEARTGAAAADAAELLRPVGPADDRLPNMRTGGGQDAPQLNVKLFMRDYDLDLAVEALDYVVRTLESTSINHVFVAVPATGVKHIGLSSSGTDSTAASEDEDLGSVDNLRPEASSSSSTLTPFADPDKEAYAKQMLNLWDTLSGLAYVEKLGLCDMEPDVFKRVYREARIKPLNVQVNLERCCAVPPELRSFAAGQGIELLTHSDSPDFLGPEFCAGLVASQPAGAVVEVHPRWIVRFHVFQKDRGVLQDKRYLIALDVSTGDARRPGN